MPIPLAYLITFSCYGARLHGDASGSVDRHSNSISAPLLSADPSREVKERERMKGYSYEMEFERREIVRDAIQALCIRRTWILLAVHVRTNHLHFVVRAEVAPERIMRDAKAAASALLNKSGLDKPETRRWAYHGSTRYLWKPVDVSGAVEYVVYQQGTPMAVWKTTEPRP